MIERWKAAGLLTPALLTLAVLPVLIGLGTWQLQRKIWKEDLISRIETRAKAEPVSYTAALSKLVQNGDIEYLRVRVNGTFDHAHERHLYAPTTAAQGWHVYALFRPEGGQPPLFVNRGWVPNEKKDAASRPEGQLAGPVTVTGLLRSSQKPGLFTPASDVTANRWFVRDIDAMFEPSPVEPHAPFSLDAEAEPANPGGWPKGGTTEIKLFNSHLQYVVTWYGLALTLIGVFWAYARQRLCALDGGEVQP